MRLTKKRRVKKMQVKEGKKYTISLLLIFLTISRHFFYQKSSDFTQEICTVCISGF